MKKYEIQLSAFGGEATTDLCVCENKEVALFIAQVLVKNGKFKGEDFLTGQNTTWDIRIIEFDDDSNVDVIFDSGEKDE